MPFLHINFMDLIIIAIIGKRKYLIDCIVKSFNVLEKFQEEQELGAGEYMDYLQIRVG